MFACISPGSSSSDHTVNTLRYADRLKEGTGIKSDVIKIIEDQSKNMRKKTNILKTSLQQQQSFIQKRKETEENEKSNQNVQKQDEKQLQYAIINDAKIKKTSYQLITQPIQIIQTNNQFQIILKNIKNNLEKKKYQKFLLFNKLSKSTVY